MPTPEIIENQEKEAKQLDTKYTVTLKYGNIINEEKPVLEALLPGIRLHFLRYGLFSKEKDKVGALRIMDENDDNFTLDDADASNDLIRSTDQFRVARTPLRKGYVYLISEEDINDYHELFVDRSGMYSSIIWSGDNLESDGKTPKDFRSTS